MKTKFKKSSAIVYCKDKIVYCKDKIVYCKDKVVKSLYFLLVAALLLSISLLPEPLHAGDILFGAQITNKDKFSGTLSGRFLKDFDASDLYIMAYPTSEVFAKSKLFSLTMINNDPSNLVWKKQVSMVAPYGCIKTGGWGSLVSIDFNPLKNHETGEIPDFTLVMVLVKSGGDPLKPSDWHDSATTSLITDPGERVPGQTLFVTDQSNNRYYPSVVDDGAVEPNSPEADKDSDSDSDTSEVEKPDIYKISGNRLFYANGSAGRFQVVDISKPETPRIIHSESLQNTPLDLYISNDYVILLEQMSQRDDVSVVLKVFNAQGDIIQKVAEQAYPNIQYIASRKSGNRIFITGTSPSYYPYGVVDNTVKGDNTINGVVDDTVKGENTINGDGDDTVNDDDTINDDTIDTVEGGSLVVAVDISTPTSPTLLSKKTLQGYDSDIYLNSDYLVQIVRENWETTVLHLFDLHQNDPLTQIAQIKIPGRVPSEYHVNIDKDTLSVIYRDQDITKGSALKIFEINSGSLTEKSAIDQKIGDQKIGVTEKGVVEGIAPGEELFGATFMGERAYIVTYERKDPLWVVNISDHAAPKIMGELEVPGWSEYIRFYKNRLIALGYDDSDGKRRVSVALFSVEDPLKPVLLDRATPLSGISDYTYSVAIDDDRGFYWNTSSGVIMVPISYYTDGNYSGLEIIHVDSSWNSFKREDFVPSDFNVQRGTEADSSNSQENLKDIVLSMGDAALNTINISSDQKPVILGELRLAYNTEKIALYEGDATNEDDATGGKKSIFAIGGDFYTNGTSDLMRYDSENINTTGNEQISGGQFNFTEPDSIKDSELLYPELLLDKTGFGVILSWSSSAFRLFDQKSMTMGNKVKLGDISTWNTSDLIISKNHLYFALSQYVYPQEKNPDTGEITYIWDNYTINTILKRYNCSDINTPQQLPDISIPGTPKTIFNDTRLITVETNRYYYYPMYYNKTVDPVEPIPVEPIMPKDDDTPEVETPPQGTRINAIELGQNSGVLDRTAFFDQETYGYSEVICDAKNIYIVAMKDSKTNIHTIDPTTLKIVNSYTVEGSFSPVKAKNGRIILTSSGYYPYFRYEKSYIPYWNNREIKVIDVSGEVLKDIAKFSTDLYPSQNNTVMEDDGIYIANGYRGIVYFSFN